MQTLLHGNFSPIKCGRDLLTFLALPCPLRPNIFEDGTTAV
jgi:hypothetical protein